MHMQDTSVAAVKQLMDSTYMANRSMLPVWSAHQHTFIDLPHQHPALLANLPS
jgi:hypothetical protein